MTMVLEHFNDFADPRVAEVVEGAPRVDPADGCFAVPTAPGLGVRLDHAAVARHPRTHAYLNLVQEGWELRGALGSP
jgi:galactonate dehydratase